MGSLSPTGSILQGNTESGSIQDSSTQEDTEVKKIKKIRVAFIVYAGEIWDKELPIYEAMLKSEDFKPFLVLIPNFDYLHRKLKTEYGDEKEYFEQFAHENNLIYFYQKNDVKDGNEGNNTGNNTGNEEKGDRSGNENKFVNRDNVIEKADLSKYNFDYVFYQTPYNTYFPSEVRSGELVKYTKVCLVPYASWGVISTFIDGFTKDFYRNLYLGFMEESENAEIIGRRFFLKNHHHILFRGYPVLENIHLCERQKTIRSILWTPRWTYSQTVGGSHFFEYKDNFIALKDDIPELNVNDTSLMIRPHQLAFDNFVKEGLLSLEELQHFKDLIREKGIAIDNNKTIGNTFKTTDLLLTDSSSIIVPFLLSGKPIILCDSHTLHNVNLASWCKQILNCLYIANSWADVQNYIRDLLAGNDYFYQKRKEVILRMSKEHIGASNRILKTLRQDFNYESL